MVEAEISPELLKKKRRKKKKKKEARQQDPMVEAPGGRCRAEGGFSTVPRLPKLLGNRSLVGSAQDQEREEVLPGSFPEYRSYPLPYQERYGDLGHRMLFDTTGPSNPSERGGVHFSRLPQQQKGEFCHTGEVGPAAVGPRRGVYMPRTRGRRAELVPIHSRTNLMDAELMDADSDFWGVCAPCKQEVLVTLRLTDLTFQQPLGGRKLIISKVQASHPYSGGQDWLQVTSPGNMVRPLSYGVQLFSRELAKWLQHLENFS